MKKIILLATLLCLVGCTQNEAVLDQDASVQVTLKDLPTTIEEKTQYYIHDELMPVYVMLKEYPSDSLIDWNNKTGINNNNWLPFILTQEEAVRGLELYTQGLDAIEIKINGDIYPFKLHEGHQIIDFDQTIMTSKVTIKTIGSGKLLECHITGDRQVDQETYELYKNIEEDLTILESYNWSSTAKEAFHTLDEVFKTYDVHDLEALSKDLDSNRLKYKEGGLGCPFRVSGKIVQVKEKYGYYELTIDTLLDKEKVIVYTLNERELNQMFTQTCILIEKDDTLRLITIQ